MLELTQLDRKEILSVRSIIVNPNVYVGLLPDALIPKYEKIVITYKVIEKVISDYYNIPLYLIWSKSRKREYVKCRQLCHVFARKLLSFSLEDIGYNMGKKDHATVLHSIKTINNISETDKQLRNEIFQLNTLILEYAKDMHNTKLQE